MLNPEILINDEAVEGSPNINRGEIVEGLKTKLAELVTALYKVINTISEQKKLFIISEIDGIEEDLRNNGVPQDEIAQIVIKAKEVA